MKLSIVILNYNSAHVVDACLDSLAGYGDWLKQNAEVIVVDNASTDGLVDLIRSKYPWAKLLINDENLGFSKGNNVGLRQVQGDYVLLLNPDTVVPPDTLIKCLDFLQDHPDVAVVTCKIVFPNGTIDMDCHRGFPTPWASLTYFSGLEKLFPKSKLFGQYHQTWKDLSTTHAIDAAVGAFMIIPKAAIDKVGLLDERFFFYGEDIDWCYRFKEAGYKIYYFPKCVITHYKGVSSGVRKESQKITSASQETKQKIAAESVRAMRLFYDKHYKSHYPFFVTWLVYLALAILLRKRLHKHS